MPLKTAMSMRLTLKRILHLRAVKSVPLLLHPEDEEALKRMMRLTTARIGVGRSGPRLKTKTLLTLRADHAAARDAVMTDVDKDLLSRLNLFCGTDVLPG